MARNDTKLGAKREVLSLSSFGERRCLTILKLTVFLDGLNSKHSSSRLEMIWKWLKADIAQPVPVQFSPSYNWFKLVCTRCWIIPVSVVWIGNHVQFECCRIGRRWPLIFYTIFTWRGIWVSGWWNHISVVLIAYSMWLRLLSVHTHSVTQFGETMGGVELSDHTEKKYEHIDIISARNYNLLLS